MKVAALILAVSFASSMTVADGEAAKPPKRQQVVGEIEIPTTGAPTLVRLCRNGTYVEPLLCGGFIRGRWKLEDAGVALQAQEVCLVLGVRGSEAGGASAECVFYRRYRFLGCVSPERALALADGSPNGVPVGRPSIDVESLSAMLAGRPQPGEDAEDGYWTWKLHRTPEPRECNASWRPRNLRDLGFRAR